MTFIEIRNFQQSECNYNTTCLYRRPLVRCTCTRWRSRQQHDAAVYIKGKMTSHCVIVQLAPWLLLLLLLLLVQRATCDLDSGNNCYSSISITTSMGVYADANRSFKRLNCSDIPRDPTRQAYREKTQNTSTSNVRVHDGGSRRVRSEAK